MIKKLLNLFVISSLLFWQTLAFAASLATCYDTADCKVMLHMNGTDGGTTFTDEIGGTWTTVAQAQIDTAQSKFGGASGLFDGTGDYIWKGQSSDWSFGTSAVTIDLQVRFNSLAAEQGIIGNNTDASNFWSITWTTDNLLHFESEDAGVTTHNMTFSWTPLINTWYHIALIRSGNDWLAFIDGTQIGTTVTDADGVMTGDLGYPQVAEVRQSGGGLNIVDLNGWVDEARVVNGTAVWTANFTAPSVAYLVCGRVMTMVD